ncbi:hypothetical protein [Variovorax paradoxus]|uniref:hypothetical protein n=1 Tax=Variovorax paradoxus TaxID=34073 RepID=UPI0027D8A907|nr:hypothetical protein [Variovorax paradoxus]
MERETLQAEDAYLVELKKLPVALPANGVRRAGWWILLAASWRPLPLGSALAKTTRPVSSASG